MEQVPTPQMNIPMPQAPMPPQEASPPTSMDEQISYKANNVIALLFIASLFIITFLPPPLANLAGTFLFAFSFVVGASFFVRMYKLTSHSSKGIKVLGLIVGVFGGSFFILLGLVFGFFGSLKGVNF
jgi:hypothetical protein